MEETAYIGIGSNLGASRALCLEAVTRMDGLPFTRREGLSPWYSSRPVGVEGQGWYVNGVACVRTSLTAGELLRGLLRIEADMGRVRKEAWEARLIDLDLLLYGDHRVREQDLHVPHPRLHQRRFVLVPLVNLAPGLVHPVLGMTVAELLDGLEVEGQELFALKAGVACEF